MLTLYFFRIAGHPLAQNEKCLHMFLQVNPKHDNLDNRYLVYCNTYKTYISFRQEPNIDRNYVPGKIRNA